jgi:bisphosphoglycerate-dependent phosphoglycerate mutase
LSELPAIYLARHGETAWSVTGQHTRLTDLSLTERGECNARTLGKRLEGLEFARVFVSPLQRASRTCELAGFARRPKSIGSWSNGTTENTKVFERLTFTRSDQTGKCSATDSPEANHWIALALEPTAS